MTAWNNGEYSLLKGFAKHVCDADNFNNNLKNCEILHTHQGPIKKGGLSTINAPNCKAHQFVWDNKTSIQDIVKQKLKLDRQLDLKYSGSLITTDGGIPVHSDWYPDNERQEPDAVVARAILTINPEYVFGTDVFWDRLDMSRTECLGGYPGDLLMFKCSPISFHSVGMRTEEHADRYSINMMFRYVN
jgi:hypothetical protein